ncbi:MAG: glutaredoxin domain-containing protein [Candidatus Buchananbacteria bacterium]
MPKIEIYTLPTCPYCRALKAFLDDNKISYIDYDVSTDSAKADEMVKKSDQMGTPVLDIDGKIIVGFDRQAISEVLGIK